MNLQQTAFAIYELMKSFSILKITNCMTRLRLQLNTEDIANLPLKELKNIPNVLRVNLNDNELQIILGPGKVNEVTSEFKKLYANKNLETNTQNTNQDTNNNQKSVDLLLESLQHTRKLEPNDQAKIYYDILNLYDILGNKNKKAEYVLKCKEVKEMTPRMHTLVEDMYDTMYEAMGVGLAAPQVGILKRIVVIDTGEEGECVTLVNPVITLKEGEQVGEEGCLSLPGKVAVVKRPDHVICEAFDEDMNPITVEGFGLFARALCHETDHLDGILYPDVAEEPARDVTMEEVE